MTHTDYTFLDRPEVLTVLFHPRREPVGRTVPGAEDLLIPVGSDQTVGARWHTASPDAPDLLFFHGNGEIVADYDDLGPLYTSMGINLLAVDYRGYGRSSGTPSVSTMMADSHRILSFCEERRREKAHSGPLILMGRSLGSASVLELAAAYPQRIHGLIIESGFAFAAPLLRLLGLDPERIGFDESKGFGQLDKIGAYAGPTLIIHAAHDHIIPFGDSEALFAASPAPHKQHVTIPGANHNDILLRGMTTYLEAVRTFCHACRTT